MAIGDVEIPDANTSIAILAISEYCIRQNERVNFLWMLVFMFAYYNIPYNLITPGRFE